MEGGESFVVNSSARHCNRCHKKIRHAVTAVDTGGVGAAVDASAGGGRDTDAVHDLARATSDVLIFVVDNTRLHVVDNNVDRACTSLLSPLSHLPPPTSRSFHYHNHLFPFRGIQNAEWPKL